MSHPSMLSSIPKPHAYRLGIGFYLAYGGLLLACVIVVVASAKTFFGLVVDEFGQPLGSEEMTLTVIMAFVGLTWMGSLMVLSYQLFIRRNAFRTSETGLHDLTVGGILMAFIVILPIRFIPWESLEIDTRSLVPSLRIRKGFDRDFPLIPRLLLRVYGLRLSFFYAKLDSTWMEYIVNQTAKEQEIDVAKSSIIE